MQTTTRNATLGDLATLLREQHARKLDVAVPASQLRSDGGLLRIAGAEAQIDASGVTAVDGLYRPTSVCDEGIAEKLRIPTPYLKRLRDERPDLYDENVNGWLHGVDRIGHPLVSADPRTFLVRCFRGDDGGEGIARAFLSDTYRMIDNLDVLTSALEGVQAAGAEVEIEGCDLTERRMYVRIIAPSITALAPTLLRAYRSPFDGDGGVARAGETPVERGRRLAAGEGMGYGAGQEPVVFAGFVISNSEVGDGAFSIVPRVVVQVCKNGLTITADAMRHVHLGGRLDAGIVRWSEDTQRKNLDLVAAQARDAVATFLDAGYVERVVGRIEERSGTRVVEPARTVETVCSKLRYSEARTASVLDHFIRGGDLTAGGVMQAVTSVAQTLANADKAHEMEGHALSALDLAASLS